MIELLNLSELLFNVLVMWAKINSFLIISIFSTVVSFAGCAYYAIDTLNMSENYSPMNVHLQPMANSGLMLAGTAFIFSLIMVMFASGELQLCANLS